MKIFRPFSSGSRQPPDPIDQYLSQVGFYRKHTARDSSSLYRAVSEQMFHTQNYHQFVRTECLKYMGRIRKQIAQSLNRDVDAYLNEQAKPRAHGTLVELRALAHLFRRNVMLFKEFDTGNWLIDEPQYADDACLMLFYTAENHFDSVYDQQSIEDAAFCQSMCYEVLYSYVYKLPDVEYAVERMLHDPNDGTVVTSTTFVTNEIYNNYPVSIMLSDHRFFRLDRPDNTRCVLEDYKMCHFHNEHFEALYMELRSELTNSHGQYGVEKARKMLQSLLPEKLTSCVRQLLLEGITPFPYKVAKALDPCIYRNIEYDTWSDMRREQRMRNWNVGHNLQVGSKCLVRLYSNQVNPYTCHIQEIRINSGKCMVFIEDLAEKRCVPFSAISSPDIANGRHHNRVPQHQYQHQGFTKKPSSTYNPGAHVHSKKSAGTSTGTIKYEYSKQAMNAPVENGSKKMDSTSNKAIYGEDHHESKMNRNLSDGISVSHLTSPSNFQPTDYEIIAAPVMVGGGMAASGSSRPAPQSKVINGNNHRNNHGGHNHHYSKGASNSAKGKSMNGGAKNFPENNHKFTDKPKVFQNDGGSADTYIAQQRQYSQPPPFGGFFYYYDNPWNEATFDPNADPQRMAANNTGYGAPPRLDRLRNIYENPSTPMYMPGPGVYSDFIGYDAANAPPPPPPPPLFDPNPQFYAGTEIPIKRRDLLEQAFAVNLEAPPSFDPRGHDIAVNDPGTLRFFYNLGHEYFEQLRTRFGMATVAQLTQFTDKLEQPPPVIDSTAPMTPGMVFPDCFGQQSSEMDNLVYKTNQMKVGGKSSVHHHHHNHHNAKGDSSTNIDQQRRPSGGGGGGQGKTGHSKRYSSNRSNVSNDCDSSVTTTESDSKVVTPTPLHSKVSVDTIGSPPVDTNQPQVQPPLPYDGGSPFHTPQRYHHSEHAPPLLRTPAPIDGPYNTSTVAIPEMSPLPSVIPMPAAGGHHAYPQYIPFFPVDDQQAMYMQMPCAYGGTPGFQTFAPYTPAPPPHAIHGQQPSLTTGGNLHPTFIYGVSGQQQIAMAPQGYWYPPPTIMPVQTAVTHVPAAANSSSSSSAEVPRSPLKANPGHQTSSSPSQELTND